MCGSLFTCIACDVFCTMCCCVCFTCIPSYMSRDGRGISEHKMLKIHIVSMFSESTALGFVTQLVPLLLNDEISDDYQK